VASRGRESAGAADNAAGLSPKKTAGGVTPAAVGYGRG